MGACIAQHSSNLPALLTKTPCPPDIGGGTAPEGASGHIKPYLFTDHCSTAFRKPVPMHDTVSGEI